MVSVVDIIQRSVYVFRRCFLFMVFVVAGNVLFMVPVVGFLMVSVVQQQAKHEAHRGWDTLGCISNSRTRWERQATSGRVSVTFPSHFRGAPHSSFLVASVKGQV